LALFFNTNGQLEIRHSYYHNPSTLVPGEGSPPFGANTRRWTVCTNDPGGVATTDWVRITIEISYLGTGQPATENLFRTKVNGGEWLSSAYGWPNAVINPSTDAGVGGPWHLCANSGFWNTDAENNNSYLTAFEVRGDGLIDELLITDEVDTNVPPRTPFEEWMEDNGLTDPDGNDDGDEASNREEYEAGTNPNNSNSVFKIIYQWQDAGGTNWIQWLGSTNSGVYTPWQVFRTTDLKDTTSIFDWDLVEPSWPRDPTGTNTWWDTDSPAIPAYYMPALTNLVAEP
jgi:hypothetical protein